MSILSFRRVVALAAMAIALASCGSDTGDDVATDAPPNPGVVGTADGGQIDFGSLEGSDTLLWFWAPW